MTLYHPLRLWKDGGKISVQSTQTVLADCTSKHWNSGMKWYDGENVPFVSAAVVFGISFQEMKEVFAVWIYRESILNWTTNPEVLCVFFTTIKDKILDSFATKISMRTRDYKWGLRRKKIIENIPGNLSARKHLNYKLLFLEMKSRNHIVISARVTKNAIYIQYIYIHHTLKPFVSSNTCHTKKIDDIVYKN